MFSTLENKKTYTGIKIENLSNLWGTLTLLSAAIPWLMVEKLIVGSFNAGKQGKEASEENVRSGDSEEILIIESEQFE